MLQMKIRCFDRNNTERSLLTKKSRYTSEYARKRAKRNLCVINSKKSKLSLQEEVWFQDPTCQTKGMHNYRQMTSRMLKNGETTLFQIMGAILNYQMWIANLIEVKGSPLWKLLPFDLVCLRQIGKTRAKIVFGAEMQADGVVGVNDLNI